MIRVGGENVAAAEVEGFLLQHPAVKQTVVVGRAEPRLGEVCVAFVELKDGAATTEQELLDACRGGLASFKVPRQIHLVGEWPMSGTGKIQKFLLAEAARNDTDA
jgi:fatty-acyl-CoA synthase